MKKTLSLILAMILVLSLSFTAFADDQTIITAEIPDNTPKYTLHIPADMTLEYNNTEKQLLGNLYVTDCSGISSLWCSAKYTDLINTADSSDTISLTMTDKAGRLIRKKDGYIDKINNPFTLYSSIYSILGWSSPYNTEPINAVVSSEAWEGATPGATYKATITYIVDIK